jgi:RNA polymerase sigma-70 factor (ECF subfamily)
MNDKKITDRMLIAKFRKGSLEAFEELLSRYESKIFNLAMRLSRNQEDSEEIAQDVFSTLYKKVGSFEGKSAFSSWLYRIVVNASFMKLRKRKQRPTMYLEDLSPGIKQSYLDEGPSFLSRSDTINETREVRDALQGAIDKLPEQYRAVFVLRDVDGLSNQEVGEILDISIPAVKSRLHRSRLMLRKKLLRFYKDYTGIKHVVIDDGPMADL